MSKGPIESATEETEHIENAGSHVVLVHVVEGGTVADALERKCNRLRQGPRAGEN